MTRQPTGGRRGIVVLGPHRSGTSAVAGMVMLLGVDGPENPLPPTAANEAGYWEPAPIVQLNDEILQSLSSGWNEVGQIPEFWLDKAFAADYLDRAVELLAEEYGASSLFMLKDPRISRMAPFWAAALRAVDAVPGWVLTIRNPLEVAASLHERDGILPNGGLLLWLWHTLEAERATRGEARAFVSYSRTLNDWESVAREVSGRLDLDWPRPVPEAKGDIERFLSVRLRRHTANHAELDARDDVVEWVKVVFAEMDGASESGRAPNPKVLDRVRSQLHDADVAYGAILAEAMQQLQTARIRGAAREHQQSQALQAARAESEVRARALKEELTKARAESNSIGRQLAVQEAQAGRLAQESERIAREREYLRDQLAGALALAEERAALLVAARQVEQEQLRYAEALASWIEHLERSRSWRLTSPFRRFAAASRRLVRKPSIHHTRPAIPAADAAPVPALPPGAVTAAAPVDGVPTVQSLRRSFLARHADAKPAQILEIGALSAPTYDDDEGQDVRHLDWFSREELIELHGNDGERDPAAIPHIDYVIKSPLFGEAIADHFDLVIANHVLEHVPDAIRWLQQIEKISTDGGRLFLAIPDRRYTFDYLRPESTFVDLLRTHDQRLDRADFYHVLSSILYHRPVFAPDAWAGRIAEALAQSRLPVPMAIARARELAKTYTSVHCHVFTRDSFERVFADLAESGLTSWQIEAIEGVARNQCEFHVLLRKSAS